ncbi:MAG: protein kinase domain-containing protein, partial [Planctomycetota bacterium]
MSPRYVLLVESGDLRKEIAVGEEPLLVGRGPEAKLRLPDDYCSRVHGKFVEREGHLYVEDVGARNGIFVNGERVLVDARLGDGDEVRMGRTAIVVRKSAGYAAPVAPVGDLSDTQTKDLGPEGIQFVEPAMDLGFHLVRLVAVSGMGLLFEAKDVTSERRVAFKILRPDRATEANVARAVEEAKSLSSIHHENVVRILSTGRMKNGESFLVMDYVEGQTATQLGKAARLGIPESLKIASETCGALHAVHSRGMIHRDVKPSNVMVEDKSHRTVLIDFSLALTEAGGLAGAPAGTIIFCAPEQVQPQTPGETMHPAIDIYGLGGTLYFMVAGVHPFRGTSTLEIQRKKLEGPIPSVREKQPNALPELDELVARCLQPRAEQRPAG